MIRKVEVGDEIHFLGSVTYTASFKRPRSGRISTRGETITVDTDLIEATSDRNDFSWLDLVDDEIEQTRRWGQPMIARGPADPALSIPEVGSSQWAQERATAIADAYAAPTSTARMAALAEVNRKFGNAPSSRIIAKYAGDPV